MAFSFASTGLALPAYRNKLPSAIPLAVAGGSRNVSRRSTATFAESKDTLIALAELTHILLLIRCRNATDDRTGNLASSPQLAGSAAALPLANTVEPASGINGHQHPLPLI